jgi:hypothetical protein
LPWPWPKPAAETVQEAATPATAELAPTTKVSPQNAVATADGVRPVADVSPRMKAVETAMPQTRTQMDRMTLVSGRLMTRTGGFVVVVRLLVIFQQTEDVPRRSGLMGQITGSCGRRVAAVIAARLPRRS